MFNLLFTNFLDLQRHEQASFSEQRQAYLHKLHADGMGIRHLRGLAGLLIAIDELLALRESDTFEIPLEYIVQKTSEWDSMTRQQRCDMRVEVNFHCRFLGASKRWLTYLGRLDHRYYPEDNIISKIFQEDTFEFDTLSHRCIWNGSHIWKLKNKRGSFSDFETNRTISTDSHRVA